MKSVEIKAKFYRGLSDTSRLMILHALQEGVLTVSEIVEITGLSQSNVSNHLSCLKECGLVVSEQEGRFVQYKLSDKRVNQLLKIADELILKVAKEIHECAKYNCS